jgi:tryptophan halogenase
MQITNVTIVGGGSSGWMTAAALAKTCPKLNITLVESPNIKTVGVGESTLGHINRFMGMLDLKDEDWMKPCNATYKNSIRFTNFREVDGKSFHYPFIRGFDFTDVHNGLQSWAECATLYPDEFPPETFSEMFAPSNTYLCDYGKQATGYDGKLRYYNIDADTAYHMDAGLFGQYLKNNIAIPRGVKHIWNEIESCVKDEKGNITEITCIDGQKLTADLWIDCTGFKSQILEGWMGSKFISYGNILANDKAWAVALPFTDRQKQMVNYTDCHAMNNGWVWTIPLWNRIGTGYVFSSKFISKEDALIEFKEHLAKSHDPDIVEKCQPRLVEIRHGKRESGWINNVVGVGLSYGFVEPLESTGLLTTHENIIRLMDIFNRRDGYVSRMERENYNMVTSHVTDGFASFVSMHYAYSKRTDTPYWQWATQENHYEPTMNNPFKAQVDGFASNANQLAGHTYDPTQQGGAFIMAGLGVKTVATPEIFQGYYKQIGKPLQEIENTRKQFHRNKKLFKEYIDTLPTSYEYLRDNIYGGVDEHLG